MSYLAIAYRYGWINGHWYIVACDTDKFKVLYLAEQEPRERGGKYGVQVLECHVDGEGESVETAIAYFPSAYGEEKPMLNGRIWSDSRIGSRVRFNIDRLTLDEIKEIVSEQGKFGKMMEDSRK